MKAPEVSHQNWWLVRANTDISLSNPVVSADDLSFVDCLEQLVRTNPYRETVDTNRSYSHAGYDEDETIRVEYEAGDRERPHRPQLPDNDHVEWCQAIDNEYPSLPTDKLAFDKQLSLFLQRRHEYLDWLDHSVEIVNSTTDELVFASYYHANPKQYPEPTTWVFK